MVTRRSQLTGVSRLNTSLRHHFFKIVYIPRSAIMRSGKMVRAVLLIDFMMLTFRSTRLYHVI